MLATTCLTVSSSCTSAVAFPAPQVSASLQSDRHLLVVLDGLRPDYVTPEVMPNLHALG